jgi:RNA recognition motif-containing protein
MTFFFSIILGHLSSETRAGDLEDLFQKYGNITRCDVKMGTD